MRRHGEWLGQHDGAEKDKRPRKDILHDHRQKIRGGTMVDEKSKDQRGDDAADQEGDEHREFPDLPDHQQADDEHERKH